jgi:chorismate mutase
MSQPSEAAVSLHGLDDVRNEIDRIDDALVALIHDRTRLAALAADSKRATGRALRDTRREAEVIRRAARRARDLGVDDERVREVFWRLIDLSHATVAAAGRPGR